MRLTSQAFGALLARLDPDPDRAGESYEELRRVLARFFEWRSAARPDECADQALDRVARRLGDGVVVEDVRKYTLGVARLVLLESLRPGPEQPIADPARLEQVAAPAGEADEDPRPQCLDRCLGELPADARDLILGYYAGDHRARIEQRHALATRLGVSENGLRSRAQRLRDRLEACVRNCVASRKRVRPG